MNKYPNILVKFKEMDRWIKDPLPFSGLTSDKEIIALTGHRPDKLGGDYSLTSPLWMHTKQRLQDLIDQYRPHYMISGMVLGADTLWAQLAIENNIPLIAAIPFEGQDIKWPNRSRSLYHELLSKATMIVNVSGQLTYKLSYMQLRNEWMVDNCTKLVAVWNRSAGGTANCVKYAKTVKKDSELFLVNPFFEHSTDFI